MDYDGLPPNGLPLSCAALIDWNNVCVILTVKNRTISGPRSGVSYSGGLGGDIVIGFTPNKLLCL
jgi:hypothetical protein